MFCLITAVNIVKGWIEKLYVTSSQTRMKASFSFMFLTCRQKKSSNLLAFGPTEKRLFILDWIWYTLYTSVKYNLFIQKSNQIKIQHVHSGKFETFKHMKLSS